MTTLQKNSEKFVELNYELIINEIYEIESNKLNKLLNNDLLFENLCNYLLKGNNVCFIYMQLCIKEKSNEFYKEMQNYFA